MRYLLLPALLVLFTTASAQYKADNVKYTTVYPPDLCKTLAANPGFVLLDVRSQGEFDDTLSSSPGLNIGHIKGAMHIDIRELPNRWRELLAYKDKPLFIYCSHSQRSRRASRLLSDSGFTRIFNVNQGLTGFYIDGIDKKKCNSYTIETNLPYNIVSPAELDQNWSKKVSFAIIDIREDSAYNGTTSSGSINAHGRFANATHIPLSQLATSLSKVPKNISVLIVDDYGDQSPVAAKLLHDNGYTNVYILFNGMEEWVDHTTEFAKAIGTPWKPGVSYRFLSAGEFAARVSAGVIPTIIDVRTADEFNNQSKNYWQNIGQVKGAINIPSAEVSSQLSALPSSKNAPLVIYGFNNNDYVYAAAAALKQAGYTNISLVRGGIWTLRWASHNIAGKASLEKVVINVPESNL